MSAKVMHSFGPAPVIMGVVNVTPDSFSDGGQYINKNKAIEHGLKLVQEGAQLLDIGGESSRPGAQVVDIQEEIDRVLPVIEGLINEGAQLSLDTRNAQTMREGLKAGVTAINDISGLTHDSESINVVSKAQCPVFLMHMQGRPDSMQKKPSYNNVINDIYEFLESRIKACETVGIEKKNIILDVGIGFGKTLEHNLLLLRNISKFHGLGCPLLLGTSRKSFIDMIDEGTPPDSRLGGSLSSALWGLSEGVQFFRVHDVKETRQAFDVYDAIRNAGSS